MSVFDQNLNPKNFLKVMRIVSIFSKLLKTVGLLAVRLDLTELRSKNRKKMSHF